MRDYIPIRNVARTICGIQNQTLYHHCLEGSIEWSGEGNYHSPKCAVQIDSFLKWLKENFAYRDSMDFLSVEAYLKAYREGNTDADYYVFWRNKRMALRGYIEKVIADACKSENRPNDVTFDAFIIDNTALLLILHCKYLRVQRRVYYRILNNVPKHFRLSIVDAYGLVDVDNPDYVVSDYYVEAGYTVADIKVGKKHYFPWASCRGSAVDRVHESLRDGDFDKCVEFREAMKSVGGSQFYYDDLNSAYERYKADYKRAFGKEPISVSVQRI